MRRSTVAASTALLILTGCSGGSAEAEAAAEECAEVGGDRLALDGSAVRFEVTGDEAAAIGNLDPESPDVDLLAEVGDAAFSALFTLGCLTEATGYPGSVDDLRDGDEWDVWRYVEEDTVGSEIRFTFLADG
ncbi:hypothetical protein [Serinicoccus sp. LYQ131]|uniref:hypothetical protein n=1 Tax=Serinicoccus sp. LYQ131 TaxID=3378797 RepID=UPI003853A4CD